MKLSIFRCLSLIVFLTPLAYSQSVTRCGGPNNALYINWPMFHFDVCHTGYNPYETTVGVGNINSLDYWLTYAGGATTSPPAVVNGTLYYYSGPQGTLYADDAQTGKEIWEQGVFHDLAYLHAPAVANGVVYIGGSDILYAFDAGTGAVRWANGGLATITTSPTVSDGRVYIGADGQGTSSGIVYALNAATGDLLWQYDGLQQTQSSPAVVNGVVYIGSDDRNVYALNAVTGLLLWKYTALGPVRSSPTVFNGAVYFADAGAVYAVSATAGTLLWMSPVSYPVESTPAIANGMVYVTSGNYINGKGALYALDAATGTLHWQYNVGFVYPPSSPSVANGVVYATSFDGTNGAVVGLEAATGTLLFRSLPQETENYSPVLVNGVLYYADNYFGIRSFHLRVR